MLLEMQIFNHHGDANLHEAVFCYGRELSSGQEVKVFL